MKGRQLFSSLLRISIGLFLLGYLIYRLDFRTLALYFERTLLHWGWIGAGIGLTFVGLCAGAVRWRLIVRSQGLALGFRRAMAIFFIGQFFNSFLLGACGGDVARALLVARENASRRTEAAATVFIDRFFGLFVLIAFCCIMILSSLSLFAWNGAARGPGLFMIGLLAGFLVTVFMLFRRNRFEHWPFFIHLENRTRIGPLLRRAYDAFYLFHQDPPVVIRSIALSLLNTYFLTLACMAFGRALDVRIGWTAYFTLFPIISVIAAIPITPGSLGIRESLFVSLFGALGVDGHPAILMSLLVYAGGLVWSLFGGLLFLGYSAGAGVTVNMIRQEAMDGLTQTDQTNRQIPA